MTTVLPLDRFPAPFLSRLNEFTGKHFGLLIAYVLPGFITLFGARPLSPTLVSWLAPAPTLPAGLSSVVFVGLASVAAGMVVSAIRWLLIDTLHAYTGLPRPTWNDAALGDRLEAFEAIVDAHYRHYQFYANAAIAVAFCYLVALTTGGLTAHSAAALFLLLVLFEALCLVTSRDTLRHYYRRAANLLHPYP